MSGASSHEVDVIVPQVGEAIAEATLVRWHKREGDPVRRGEVLFEVDLDKSTVEVEAFDDGILGAIVVPDDSPVTPLQKVGILLVEGPARAAANMATPGSPDGSSSPVPGESGEAPPLRSFEPSSTGPVSPRARRLAKELGVDLDQVSPTGEDGMISVADVERVAARDVADRPGGAAPLPAPGDREPLSRIRASVAERMTRSKGTVPHFYLTADVNMARVVAIRERAAARGTAPTVTTLLVAAAAAALRAKPEFNASFVDGDVVQRDNVSIGVAVATDDGLRVPIIREADRLSIGDLDIALREAAERARRGRLRESDVGSKSFVITNLGMYGVDAFLAIIDEPDPFILAVGRIRDAVVAVDGAVAIRPMATLSLSVDHRIFDGADAARLLGAITSALDLDDPDSP